MTASKRHSSLRIAERVTDSKTLQRAAQYADDGRTTRWLAEQAPALGRAYLDLYEQYEGERARALFLQKVVDEAEATERKLKEQLEAMREALQMLGGIHPDKVGDWEFVTTPTVREGQMRSFARDVLADSSPASRDEA